MERGAFHTTTVSGVTAPALRSHVCVHEERGNIQLSWPLWAGRLEECGDGCREPGCSHIRFTSGWDQAVDSGQLASATAGETWSKCVYKEGGQTYRDMRQRSPCLTQGKTQVSIAAARSVTGGSGHGAEGRSQAGWHSAAGLHLPATQKGQRHGEDQLVPRAAGVGKARQDRAGGLIG